MARTITDAGRRLIQSFEQLRLVAYLDLRGIPTIGWGHTQGVRLGQRITETDAVGYLEQDLAEAERGVEAALKVPVTDAQFSALVSLAFNVGTERVAGSTLLRKLNEGDVQGAAAEFPRWDHAAGLEVAGLLRRRLAEQRMFLSEAT